MAKKTNSAESSTILSPTEKERTAETTGGDSEKEISIARSSKEIKRAPRRSKTHVDHEQTPSSVDNASPRPNSDAQEPALSTMVPPQNLAKDKEPAKKRKKLVGKAPQDLSVDTTSAVEEPVGSTKKRKISTSAPLVPKVPEEDGASHVLKIDDILKD